MTLSPHLETFFQERDNVSTRTKFKNVYAKNLSESTTDEDLNKIFGEYGPITSAVVMRDADGKSKYFGCFNFDNPDDAARVVDALNGSTFDEKEWYVGKAQKKSKREQELRGKLEQTMREAIDKYQGANLYIKNLDDTIDDEKLKELFSEHGKIVSCKVISRHEHFPCYSFSTSIPYSEKCSNFSSLHVMRDPSGISKGSGFGAFSTPEEASCAEHFSQMRPIAITPTVLPRMLMYPPGAPGLGQQIFYGQGPPMMPPQLDFVINNNLYLVGDQEHPQCPTSLSHICSRGNRVKGQE